MANYSNTSDAASSTLAPQLMNLPIKVTLSTSTATSAVLAVGKHRICSTADCYVRQGASTATAATAATGGANMGSFLAAGVIDYITVSAAATDGYLAGITSSGSGYLLITLQ